MVEIFNQCREEEIELDGWLEGRLQTDLHHSGGGVENFRGLNLLLPCHLLGPLSQVVLPVVVIFDEEDGEGPESDAAEECDGVKDEPEIALEDGLDPTTLGHLFDDLGSLNHKSFVMPRGEELVDEEGPGDQDEEEGVAKLWLRVHAMRVAVQTDAAASREVGQAVAAVVLGLSNAVVISVARLQVIYIRVWWCWACDVGGLAYQSGNNGWKVKIIVNLLLIRLVSSDDWPLESSLQYLISINVSDPMSIALKISEIIFNITFN